MTAHIRVRKTSKGEERFHVRYRTSGRGPILHGGTFRTREDAEHRLRLIRTQLASGVPVRFSDLPAPLAYRWIYFIRMGSEGPIKIGSAVDVNRRMAQLQTASPYPLGLMAKVPWVAGEEERLYQTFAHVRLMGEWFRPIPELLAYIALASHEWHPADSEPGMASVCHTPSESAA